MPTENNTKEKRKKITMETDNNTPPNDFQAERGVIACCILDKDCIDKCMDKDFTFSTFYHPMFQMLFKGLVQLWEEGGDVDELSLSDRMHRMGFLEDVGGLQGINDVSGAVETSLHFDAWAEIIEGHYSSRRLRLLCHQTLEGVKGGLIQVDTLIQTLDTELMLISKDRFKQGFFHDNSESVDLALAAISKRRELNGELGVTSGIAGIDFKLKGFKGSELTLVAARPSVGKTAFSLHCMKAAAVDQRVPTLYISIEMSASSLMTRMMQAMSGVPIGAIDDNMVTENQQKALDDAETKLRIAPFWIDEAPSPSIAQIRARARRLKASNGLGLVIIDYLQLIRARDSRIPREQQVAEMSNSLKGLAKELDIPILLLCQLNRQSEINGRAPKLSDLRESGQLEQDCDVCLMLWKPDEEEPNRIECTIQKNRNGQVGGTPLNFQKDTQRFVKYVEEGDYQQPIQTTIDKPRYGR